jgi:peptidoglycan/xylan/chitin deacetylase (PgdA/CDA1 family)
MISPHLRRQVTCAAAGCLAGVAAGKILRGDYGRAHDFALALSTLLLAPALIRNCAWYGDVITRFRTAQNEVWLTIDDGPDPRDTPEILDVLQRHGARATFFVIGRKVMKYPALARAMVEAGHDLQNHTYSHSAGSFWAASPQIAAREIALGSAAIHTVTRTQPTLFRAPAGLANPFVHAAAEKAGLTVTGWSADGRDGIPHDPDRVLSGILHRLRPGCIVLLHEGPVAGMPPGTRAHTLDRLLQNLHSRNYRTVRPFS